MPQEIIDLIEERIQGFERKATISKLRLVCRTFAEGLFHTQFTRCIENYVLYTDEQGIEDIIWLANPRLAPFVQSISLADRMVSRQICEYYDVDEVTKQENVKRVKAAVSSVAYLEENSGELLTFLDPAHTREKFMIDTAFASSRDRAHRQRAAYDALHPGWEASWVSMKCSMVRTLDLRSSVASLNRLAVALTNFSNVTSISTSLRPQVIMQSRDGAGTLICGTSVHGRVGYMFSESSCMCFQDRRCSYDIVWPAVADIARLSPLLPTDVPLFTKLGVLDLSFETDNHIPVASQEIQDHAASIATFISRCVALEKLCLYASSRTSYSDVDKTQCIQKVVGHLASSRSYFPALHHLLLEQIDPTMPDITTFLISQSMRRIW